MKVNVNNNVIAAVALLSRYNWFTVTAENAKTGKMSTFYATGINIDEFGGLKFNRQFATTYYSDGLGVDVAAADKNKFSFLTTAGTVYTIEAENKALADCNIASGNPDDPASLIDWERSHIDEAGNALVVMDLRKTGIISPIVNRRIAHFMNAYMGGYADCYQVCRTIYFHTTADGEIYGGVYSLETEQPITRVLYDTEYLDLVYDEKDKSEKGTIRRMMKEISKKSEK